MTRTRKDQPEFYRANILERNILEILNISQFSASEIYQIIADSYYGFRQITRPLIEKMIDNLTKANLVERNYHRGTDILEKRHLFMYSLTERGKESLSQYKVIEDCLNYSKQKYLELKKAQAC